MQELACRAADACVSLKPKEVSMATDSGLAAADAAPAAGAEDAWAGDAAAGSGRGSLKSGSSICCSTHSMAASAPAFCSNKPTNEHSVRHLPWNLQAHLHIHWPLGRSNGSGSMLHFAERRPGSGWEQVAHPSPVQEVNSHRRRCLHCRGQPSACVGSKLTAALFL